MPNEITYAAHPTEERFLKLTREYLLKLFSAANPEDKPRLMIDQLLPCSNLNQCLRYFDIDVKVIIVDRDPRDVYLLSKYIWRDGIVPKDVNTFCEWFRYTHESNKDEVYNPHNVLSIRFEDLIYNYHETRALIESFIGLDPKDNLSPFTAFNPKKSIHNTQLWKVYNDEAIGIIEDRLNNYLYDYNSFKSLTDIAGIDVVTVNRF